MRTPSSLLLLSALLASCSHASKTAATQDHADDGTEARYVDTLALNHPEYLPSIPLDTIAPEICAPDTAGNVVSLSDFAGRYVVVDFWATWCGDCRHEAPIFADVYAEWHDRQIDGADIQFLGYSFDRDAERWKQTCAKPPIHGRRSAPSSPSGTTSPSPRPMAFTGSPPSSSFRPRATS